MGGVHSGAQSALHAYARLHRFQMFVTTRLKSPHFPSNLLRHMCVINFSITKLQVAPASSHEPRFSPKLQCLGVLCGSALGSLQATYNWTHPQHAAKSMVHIHSIQEYGAHSLNSRVWCTFTQFKSMVHIHSIQVYLTSPVAQGPAHPFVCYTPARLLNGHASKSVLPYG